MTVKIELPRWLAMSETLPRHLVGTILEETQKGVLFKGCALVEASISCHRCGRELTNPASRVVGYGPTCCTALGIPYPDLDDAKILAQQLREATAIQRWFPKSQIQIIGEYTISKGEETVPRVSLVGDIFKVQCHYDHRLIIKSVPGWSWDNEAKTWDFLASPATARRLTEAFQSRIDFDFDQDFSTVQIDKEYLFDYQREGAQYLIDHRRALLADEMGLGKTVQAISACQARQARPVLIVCPNTLKWTWAREIQKWSPTSTFQIVDGDPQARQAQLRADVDYVIVNFELLRQKPNKTWSDDVLTLQKRAWDTVIVDEAHRVKNRKARVTQATKIITKQPQHVYLLTGTPILNRVDELWSLLNILYPKLFSSYWKFVEKFCHVSQNTWGYQVGGLKESMRSDLHQVLASVYLRRLKRDVLKDLPEMLPIKRIWVQLSGTQRQVYENMAKEMYTTLTSGETVSTAVVIAQITRLKQITIDENLMIAEKVTPLQGAKVDALFDFLETCEDEKVVIFSQFSRVLDRLELVCQQKDLSYEKLTGDVTGKDRENAVQRFQSDPDCRLFLCGMKSGGVGITLTASHIAVFLDKFWSPATNWQAQERLDRIGQTEKVTIIEFLAAETVEEGIEKMLVDKTKQFSSVFGLKKPGVEDFEPTERQELIDLLRFGL